MKIFQMTGIDGGCLNCISSPRINEEKKNNL